MKEVKLSRFERQVASIAVDRYHSVRVDKTIEEPFKFSAYIANLGWTQERLCTTDVINELKIMDGAIVEETVDEVIIKKGFVMKDKPDELEQYAEHTVVKPTAVRLKRRRTKEDTTYDKQELVDLVESMLRTDKQVEEVVCNAALIYLKPKAIFKLWLRALKFK